MKKVDEHVERKIREEVVRHEHALQQAKMQAATPHAETKVQAIHQVWNQQEPGEPRPPTNFLSA